MKGKPTADSPFFMALPSDRISKTTRGVDVHFFIYRFTCRNELIIDNALAVRNASKLYQPTPGTF